MKPVKAFFFDLGNVIVQFDHRLAARNITAHAKLNPEEMFRFFFESALVVEHDRGRITTEQFHEALCQEIGLTLAYEKFLKVWNEIFTENQETVQVIRQLLPRYPVILISNTNRPHFEHLKKTCAILNELHGLVLSYEVGELKPHPKIYQKALELVKVEANHVFYIDDRADLIAAGSQLGFQTHRFESAHQLAEDLKSRGLLNGR